jgi:prolyl-tRNA editing enzyme YbaK/EbsC (Cys-tRNA(Pro) deacylase)
MVVAMVAPHGVGTWAHIICGSRGRMKPATSPSALKVQAALGERFTVLEFDNSTRTAADAAAAIGCSVAQIAKSLIFRTQRSNRPVLVIASGANRVDEKQIAMLVEEPVVRASADFVRESTGFAIGGVPPIAHKSKPIVLIDAALSAFAEIWAAAGSPHAVFKLTPADLVALTGGRVAAVSPTAGGSR